MNYGQMLIYVNLIEFHLLKVSPGWKKQSLNEKRCQHAARDINFCLHRSAWKKFKQEALGKPKEAPPVFLGHMKNRMQ